MVNWQKAKEAIRLIFKPHKDGSMVKAEKFHKENPQFIENIYSVKDGKEYGEKWLPINSTFKYRIALPALMLLDAFFEKHKLKEIPAKEHNWSLQVFDRAFTATERDWYKYALHFGQKNALEPEEIDKGVNTCEPIVRLRSFKEWYETGIFYDNMYKEFHTMLMFNIWAEMSKEHEGKKLNHLIYKHVHIDDIAYFTLFHDLREGDCMVAHDRHEGKEHGSNQN
jgi:hypothetical protein